MSRSILSLKKASEILNIFLDEDRACGISEFARKLSMPKPTVQSLVRTLEEIGFLEKDPATARYSLGPVLFQLGMRYAAGMDLAAVARDWMQRLCTQFNEAAHAGMLVGGKVVIVLRVEPDSKFMVYPQTGSVIPLHTSAIGKVLFAYMDGEKRDEVLARHDFQKLTERSIDNRADFIREIEKARRDGIGFDNQESVTGLSCVGGPIFNSRRQCIAAFSLSGNTYTIESRMEEIAHAVRYVSYQISSRMGYRKGA
jgi:IclR family KDG regulon transcriptional repressor